LYFKNLKNLPVLQLAYQISQERGASIYLVGGAVRDVLMGLFCGKDFDFVVDDQWQEAARLFALESRGTVIPWDFNAMRIVVREAGKTVTVDFSGFRGMDISADLRERDFTINSMAICVTSLFQEESPRFYDPLGGRKHIQEKVVQADSDAAFDQDPLRILRAIRFARALDFSIEDATRSLMRQKARFLTTVAQERITRELFTVFDLPQAPRSVQELAELDIMRHLMPELSLFAAIRQGTPREHNLSQQPMKTVENLSALIEHPQRISDKYAAAIHEYLQEYIEEGVITRRALLIFAGFIHDSGYAAKDNAESAKEGLLRGGQKGLKRNRDIARRLLLGRKALRILETITMDYERLLHLTALQNVSSHAVQRFLHDVAEAPLEVLLLALADLQTSCAKRSPKVLDRVPQLVENIVTLLFSASPGDRYQPLISGEDVMNIMCLPPGEAVGAILREIHDGERSGTFNSREEVLDWLKKKKKSASSL
jgi:poly(A) polymerase